SISRGHPSAGSATRDRKSPARNARYLPTSNRRVVGTTADCSGRAAANIPRLRQKGGVTLGKLMNFDENMSPFRNRTCAFCHMPYAGFSGPIPSVNLTMIGYPGSFAFRAGKRTAQRYTYSPWFPSLDYNPTQGLFFGGNFWDGRATGYLLQNPDAEQA